MGTATPCAAQTRHVLRVSAEHMDNTKTTSRKSGYRAPQSSPKTATASQSSARCHPLIAKHQMQSPTAAAALLDRQPLFGLISGSSSVCPGSRTCVEQGSVVSPGTSSLSHGPFSTVDQYCCPLGSIQKTRQKCSMVICEGHLCPNPNQHDQVGSQQKWPWHSICHRECDEGCHETPRLVDTPKPQQTCPNHPNHMWCMPHDSQGWVHCCGFVANDTQPTHTHLDEPGTLDLAFLPIIAFSFLARRRPILSGG